MRAIVAFGIGLLLFSGCSVTNNFTGKYITENGPYYIQLKQDSSFIYQYRSFHLFEHSMGKWTRINNKLIELNSEINNIDIPLKVTKLNKDKNDASNVISVDLNIKGSTKLSDYRCRIYINDDVYSTKRADSLSNILIKKPVKSIYFHLLKEPEITTTTRIAPPLITDTYSLENTTGNNLKITINTDDSHFYYKVFNRNPVKVKGDKIYIFDLNGNRPEKLVRVSAGTNIFSSF